ncbi:helix-turn-helix domain-containing protein [Delftia sp.]|uniref:ArsR/SmtB family transcription factor n=1 Tax=Delftia sp. TaxID=1886637 RepID=UPI00259D1EA6|nr:helix-turn-helix domain-containing protein [Delftia sp.]
MSLADLFQGWVSEVDGGLKSLVTGGSQEAPSATRQALLLGHLVVAQGLAAQALRSRADASTIEALRHFRKYLLPLRGGELSNKALADRVGQSTEHVTRKLSEMRKAGLVDFRRESKKTINFLTSMSREMLGDVTSYEGGMHQLDDKIVAGGWVDKAGDSLIEIFEARNSLGEILEQGKSMSSGRQSSEAEFARPNSNHYRNQPSQKVKLRNAFQELMDGIPSPFRYQPILESVVDNG